MNTKNPLHDTTYVKRPVTNKYDNEDFNNRLRNYSQCLTNFFSLYLNTQQLEKELNQVYIDSQCHQERMSLIDFATKTGLKYDNVVGSSNKH